MLFVALNWGLTIVTSLTLLRIYLTRRHLFTKPSIIVIIIYHLRVQYYTAVEAGYILTFLPDPWVFSFLVHFFALVGLFVAQFTFRHTAQSAWTKIVHTANSSYDDQASLAPVTLLLGLICATAVIWYLTVVPFKNTGLYVLFTDPLQSQIAREESLKLIDNPPVQYLFSFFKSAWAPLLVAFSYLTLTHNTGILRRLTFVVLFMLLVTFVSLPGQRGPAAALFLTLFLIHLYLRGLPFRPMYILIGLLCVLSIPLAISALRQGLTVRPNTLYQLLLTSLLDRIFAVPGEVGVYYTHFAQTHGHLGLTGIPKLAELLNVRTFDLPNYLGLRYMEGTLGSVNMNGGYVFTFYVYFGMLSFPLVLLGLWSLDLLMVIYKYVHPKFLAPTVVTLAVTSNSFVSSDYTTVFVTHGVGIVVLTVLLLDIFRRLQVGDRTGLTPTTGNG